MKNAAPRPGHTSKFERHSRNMLMDVLIVVDMQVGLQKGVPKHDLPAVVARINKLAAEVRSSSGTIVFIQHCGPLGDDFEPQTSGWALLPELQFCTSDAVIEKTLNDPFAGTELKKLLDRLAPDRLLISGWATDFCVDATVRSAVSNGYRVVVVADAHTVSDRPHLDAKAVIHHHNWIWSNLITGSPIEVVDTKALLKTTKQSQIAH